MNPCYAVLKQQRLPSCKLTHLDWNSLIERENSSAGKKGMIMWLQCFSCLATALWLGWVGISGSDTCYYIYPLQCNTEGHKAGLSCKFGVEPRLTALCAV